MRSYAATLTAPESVRHDPFLVRILLTAVALAFLAMLIGLPLVTVFSDALRKGIGAYMEALKEPTAVDAMQLTLLTAAIAVPANLVFGVSAAWAIAKFDFPGSTS
jgi:sulfate transport system permease protein